jgi:hypothetical protein
MASPEMYAAIQAGITELRSICDGVENVGAIGQYGSESYKACLSRAAELRLAEGKTQQDTIDQIVDEMSPEPTNWLLWGGIAAAVLVGSVWWFTRKG